MQPPVNNISGAIKVSNLPDLFCDRIQDLDDLIKALPDILTVEVPSSVSGIISGASEPTDDQTDKLWLRRDNNGDVLGLYAFQNGGWNPLYNFPPGHVEWLAIDSRFPPEGFTLIDTGGPSSIPSSVRTALVTQYVAGTDSNYLYAAYAFVGF